MYKYKFLHGNFNVDYVSKAVNKQDEKMLDHLSYSKYIVETLECFMASSDPIISEDHVPEINEITTKAKFSQCFLYTPMSSSDRQKLTKMVWSCIAIPVSFVSGSVYYYVNVVCILNCFN